MRKEAAQLKQLRRNDFEPELNSKICSTNSSHPCAKAGVFTPAPSSILLTLIETPNIANSLRQTC